MTKNLSETRFKFESLKKLGISALFVILMTLFCKAVAYPLIIPLLLFFIGYHLVWVEKGAIALFLHLGLLLSLLLFMTHAVVAYTDLSVNYIPVASMAMLTMLLFNSRTLSFIMAFISSVIVALVLDGQCAPSHARTPREPGESM